VNWENVAQRVLMRRGNLGQIRRGKQVFVAEVRSLTHFLNQPVGRTYQYYCDAELGDRRCGVSLAAPSYSASGSVATVSGDRSFTAAGLGGFALNWFALGRVEWTSGANAGRRAEVSIHSVAAGAAKITLIEAPVRAITIGDGFFIQAGCDKQFVTCRTKFGNGVNFRGFPEIPGDDTIVRYPTRGDGSTGQPL
jgi:uncharacterized phage protein (TIGR02218 family)